MAIGAEQVSIAEREERLPEGSRRPAPSKVIGYVPQIDTLRAVAVGFVFLEHYLQYQSHRLGITGGYGVWMFFSISGFLITGILLGYKDAVETSRTTMGRALRVFYIRRSLRIFPVYYLLLFVLLASGFVAIHDEFFWHFTYTTNIWTAKNNEWGYYAGHFWSLAVEEQFYLVWPFVLLTAPRKALPWIIGCGIAGALLFRICAVQLGWGLAVYTLPMANFDTLGAGALLAWLRHRGVEDALVMLRRYGGWSLLLLPVMSFWSEDVKSVFGPAVIAIIAVYMIERCVIGFDGLLGRLFTLQPILYLGKISYGLYLYHYVIRWYVPTELFDGVAYQPYVTAVVWTAATVAVAAASWHLFEAPINSLKKHFQIDEAAGSQLGAADLMKRQVASAS
jgi:peptidoglycan/LPS O-acetylase OafA/YrhL